MMNEAKSDLAVRILAAKQRQGLTWTQIGEALGHAPVFACAACLGQMALPEPAAVKAASLFGLSAADIVVLRASPYRGSLPPGPPTDPTVYRFHELVQVYGTTWKALIDEEFGDGIMSAIDFEMTLERQPDPKGDRVRLVMSGKFLPYRSY